MEGCQAGDKIKYLSEAENKKVEAAHKKMFGTKPPKAASATESAYTSPCRGKSGTFVDGNYTTHYLNSCETIDLVYAGGSCVGRMGAIGFFAGSLKRISFPAYAIGAFCGYWATLIAREQAKNDVGAVFVLTYKQEAYQPYPGQVRYYIKTTVHASSSEHGRLDSSGSTRSCRSVPLRSAAGSEDGYGRPIGWIVGAGAAVVTIAAAIRFVLEKRRAPTTT